jgi:uncharacterized protein with HEPN domain
MMRDPATLLDIAEAADRAMRFAQGLDKSAFLENEEKQWAILSQIIVLGEATSRLSDEFLAKNSHIPWGDIVGMRHRLVHGYDQINWDRVWHAAVHDIPELVKVLTPILPNRPN